MRIRLISEVEKQSVDPKGPCQKYKHLNMKEKAWETISSAVGVDGKLV